MVHTQPYFKDPFLVSKRFGRVPRCSLIRHVSTRPRRLSPVGKKHRVEVVRACADSTYTGALPQEPRILKTQPTSSHLHIYFKEAKTRFYYILFSIFITFCCSYWFADEAIYILAKPLQDAYGQSPQSDPHWASLGSFFHMPNVFGDELSNSRNWNNQRPFHFIFTDLTEGFLTQIQVSFFITLYFFIPIIFYQIWLFIKPGLYLYERSMVKTLFIISLIATLFNIFVTYFILIPAACRFFLSFEIGDPSFSGGFAIHLEARISAYFDLIIRLFCWSHLFFQLPAIVMAALKTGLISESVFLGAAGPKQRKICYLVFILVSALISPPDFISQIVILIPILLLYEFTIFFLLVGQAPPTKGKSVWPPTGGGRHPLRDDVPSG